jgi:predicted nucleic acid-binding protein
VNCYFLDASAFVKLLVQEEGTPALIRLMEVTEDNRKLISAATPLEVYAALKRRERAGDLALEDSEAARTVLRIEAARMVQQPLNPAVVEAARQMLDRYDLRSAQALQLGAALVAREMFQGLEIVFLSAQARLREAAASERFTTLDPANLDPANLDSAHESVAG